MSAYTLRTRVGDDTSWVIVAEFERQRDASEAMSSLLDRENAVAAVFDGGHLIEFRQLVRSSFERQQPPARERHPR